MLDNVSLKKLLIFFLLLAFSLLTLSLILKANKKHCTPTKVTEYISIILKIFLEINLIPLITD